MAEGDDDKPFKCRFCGRSFAKSNGLGGHMNRHREEAQEEEYQKAVAYIRSKQQRDYSTNLIWERNNVVQASYPNSNPQPPLGQNITIGYGNEPRASLRSTENKDEVEDLAAIHYMENEKTGRLQFPMAAPSNGGQAGKGSGHGVSSFISNTQPRLGQTIPFPSQDANGNTQGASIPFTERVAGPSNGGQAGKGSGHGVSSFISNTQPRLGQTIPFPSQDAYGNTQAASIPFTGPPRPQLGKVYRSNLFDIQTIDNLSSDFPYPGIHGYPVPRNNAQQVQQQQQYVDLPSSPRFRFQDVFRGNSQEFQQQHNVRFGCPPPVNIQNDLTVDPQQFQQQPIANLGLSPPVNNQNAFEGVSQEFQRQKSLNRPSCTPSFNRGMPDCDHPDQDIERDQRE